MAEGEMTGSRTDMCLIAALLVLSVGAAHGFPTPEPVCIVQREDENHTHYQVYLDPQQANRDCESWSNDMDVVLANCDGKDARVLNKTKTSLFTSECFEIITYELSTTKKYIKVICATNCTQAESEPIEDHSIDDKRSHYFLFLVLVVVVLVLVAVTAFLCNRRNRERNEPDLI